MSARVVFMGSPEFALPTLEALVAHYQVIGVVTQPDRPAGRGQELRPPPVKSLAFELGLALIQPRRLRDPEAVAQLSAWAPDVIVVAAFGQILRPEVLALPPKGCVNVHASLLPRWRGAAPVQAALLHGDRQTGVTIMLMDSGVDTGPILSQRTESIRPDDTAGLLSSRLAALGADLLLETLPAYLSGRLLPTAQDATQASYAPPLQRAAGQLDFSQPASELARRVQAFNPWPGAYAFWQGKRIKIHRAHAWRGPSPGAGKATVLREQPAVGTSEGLLVLDELQPAGKKSLSGAVFLRGARNWAQTELK